jgi:uncharacterized cupredoxin-like copper-binding protein
MSPTTIEAGGVGTAPTPPDTIGGAAAGTGPAMARPRPRRRRWPWGVAGAAVALAVAGAGYAVSPPETVTTRAEPTVLGPGQATVEIDVADSAFSPTELTVVAGTRVRFVLVNGDPINHELIVGPPEVHARHASGHEAQHPSIPGEVSVGPNRTAMTTYRFDTPGDVEFACHMPGHYEYGMHGIVHVVPAG